MVSAARQELPNPDERVKKAVHAAMRWFDKYKLTGYKEIRKGYKGSPDQDRYLVKDANAKPMWARYYDLEYCEPYVCDRDGVPRRHLEQIGSERRNGYSWYGDRPASLYKKYEKTKSRVILFIPSLEHEQAVIFNKLNHLHFIYEIECCKRGIEPESLYHILNKKELA